jgi:hypothetical protein
MTRKVFENSMVAHVWAQQNQDSGRSNNGQFFFSGSALYSYGSHFCAGYITADGIALLNADSYSVSTSKHQRYASSAVSNRTRYSVPRLTDLARILDNMGGSDGFARRPADIRTRFKAQVRAFVLEHAAALTDKSGPYILGLVGLAKSWAAIQKERATMDARAVREAEAAAKRSALQDAKTVADYSDSVWRGVVRSIMKDWNPDLALRRNIAEVRKAHKAAKESPKFSDKRVRLIWSRLQSLYKAVRDLEGLRARAAARDQGRKIIQGLRNVAEAVNNGRAAFSEHRNGGLTFGLALEGRPASPRLAQELAVYLDSLLVGLISTQIPMSATIRRRVSESLAQVRPVATAWRMEQAERKKAEAEAREAARLEKEREAREAWQRGEAVRFYATDAQGGAYLRAVAVARDDAGNITGGTLQTSRGAEVPLVHALRAFRFLKHVRASGVAWSRNGRTIRVGHFQVDRIAANGDFHAGCHFITWAEVARLAMRLGVAALESDESALELSRAVA